MRYIQVMSDMNVMRDDLVAMPWRFQLKYDPTDFIDEICHRLALGEPLAAICRSPGFPAYSTVWDWQQADRNLAGAIALAREQGEEAIALEATEIIDGLRPVPGVPPDPSRDKARAEVRLKLLAKFNPKRWGDSTQLRHADANGEKLDTQPLVSELMTMLNVTPSAGQSAAIGAKSPVGGGSGASLIEAQAVYRPPARAKANQSVALPAPAPVALHGPHSQAPAAPARKAYKPRALRREDDVTDLV